MNRFVLAACLSATLVATVAPPGLGDDITRHVDPFIGSGGHGHVFVGASVPFGAVQVGPANFHQGWDWCSGYHYSDDILAGFSHLHLGGTGIADLGDILLMPYTGDLVTSPGSRKDLAAGWASHFTHDKEQANPGFYSVTLLDHDVRAELTATERVGLHRYRYPADKPAHLAIDLQFENGGGRVVESQLRRVDETTVVGSRRSKGWAKDQRVFFALTSSKPFAEFHIFLGDSEVGDGAAAATTAAAEGRGLRAIGTYGGSPGEVLVRVGISPVSEENALANLEQEAGSADFDAVAAAAKAAWNEQLGRIRIKADERTRRIFSTALYHTMIAPALFDDHNGDYRGADGKTHRTQDFDAYTIFSLWDTYRAAHPLFTLTQPDRVGDFVQTMLAIRDQQGKLPVWHLMGNETDTMVGYHAVPVVVDAYFKGLLNADPERAYEAIRNSAMRDERGLDSVKELGYIPAEREGESVAKAMEYAIDDWCIAQMAKALGKQEDEEVFSRRAKAYREYFDTETKFMRGKLADGTWREPFDPVKSSHRRDDYCEGNGWQYLWLVPHDPEGLIELLGGDAAFGDKLDQLFTVESIKSEGASADISGLIGQYAHGNEPGHHTTYLYAFVGQQWKTARLVRQILTTLYSDQPDGLAGNEDCGQMSAWYVFSALGMYPVNPAAGVYVFGSPVVDEATIALPGGKSFTVVARNNSPESLYIQSAELNGKPYTKSYITHADVVAGGELTFTMGPEPNVAFGSASEDRPRSVVMSRSGN
ncbi:MAG: GH92 family glycosyl hydrolase [Planctomycetota bacterium]